MASALAPLSTRQKGVTADMLYEILKGFLMGQRKHMQRHFY
jgi:hypothetical protein